MSRIARASIGGICYHVLNRGNARQDVFHEDDDHSPHGPGIQAETPRTPTNSGKKVECPVFSKPEPLKKSRERSDSDKNRLGCSN